MLPQRDRRILIVAAGLAFTLALPVFLWIPMGIVLAAILVGAAMLSLLNIAFLGVPVFPYDRILSASSTDGLSWSRDPGVRSDVDGLHQSRQVYYPHVVPVVGGWRM